VPLETDRALDELCSAVAHAQSLLDGVLERASYLQQGRAEGRTYAELVRAEPQPLVVEMLSDVLDELAAKGAAFRRAEARVLHQEGLSQEAIAALFGVTRQRVSALLRGGAEPPAR
jgi:hypothetical protein